MRMRCVIALSLGVIVAIVVYSWPALPRLTMRCDRGAWHMAFSPDGRQLAVLDRDPGLTPRAQVLVWDTATGSLLQQFDCGRCVYPTRVVFAPDGKTIGVLDAGGGIAKWDMATARLLAKYDHPDWPHDPGKHHGCEILFSPEGRWLLHSVHAGQVYDVETGDVVHDYGERWPDRNLDAHGGCVAARVNGQVQTFDAITGAAVATFPITANGIPMARTGYTFSGDGSLGVYYSEAKSCWVIRNARTGSECTLAGDSDFVGDFVLSADSGLLAVSVLEGTGTVAHAIGSRFGRGAWDVHVVDTASGKQIGPWIASRARVAIAPGGKTLAVEDRAGRIDVWDWPPAPRWPLTLALGVLAMALPFATRLLPRRTQAVARA